MGFNRTDAQQKIDYGKIPGDTDVLVTHAPCYGIFDLVVGGERVGSQMLKQEIFGRV